PGWPQESTAFAHVEAYQPCSPLFSQDAISLSFVFCDPIDCVIHDLDTVKPP
uniref:Uncharacterized protein n=1 Tax=Aegilops tauschii subsp. strangulata TaxID=200361 RepID=A0A453AJU2_AEGTS